MSMDTPGQRIKWALGQRGISAAELARHLGVTRGAVHQWWSKTHAVSPYKRLEQISAYLNVRVEWLLTGRGEPLRERDEGARPAELDSPRSVDLAGINLVGVAEAEVWREGEFPSMGNTHQFAFEVRGASVNRTIAPGEYVICVDYRQARPAGPQREDLVVVKKLRASNEHKIFVARLNYCDDTWQLHYESNDSRWQHARPIRLSRDLSRDTCDKCLLEIIGYVVGVFRANPQPLASFDVLQQLLRLPY